MSKQSEMQTTMSVRLLQSVVECAGQMGLDRADILRRAALDTADLDDPDERIPMDAAYRLNNVMRDLLGPGAGLKLGRAVATHHPTILAYLVENCATLREAYTTIERYRSIVMELTGPKLTEENGIAEFGCCYSAMIASATPEILELVLSFWLKKGRNLTGEEWLPLEVHMQSALPDNAIYDEFFQCPIISNSDRTALVFDAKLLEMPILSADEKLLYYLRPIAEEMLQRLPQLQGFLQKVQETIVIVMGTGDIHLDGVASKLNVSSRTLQRRLEAEETSFANVLDEARKVAAIEYLRDRRVSITDTAFLLGFSEPSTFYRAFKRWTGMTPGSYRKSGAL